MSKDNSGPAFPVLHQIDGNWVPDPIPEYMGISKREYFAAAALTGILASDALKPADAVALAWIVASLMLKEPS